MTAIPASTSYDLWKTSSPSDNEWEEMLTIECDNFLDEDEEVPCDFSGKVEVGMWKTGRWTAEWAVECPKCGSDIRGEYEYDPS